MADPPAPRNLNKRVVDWALLQLAATRDAQEFMRSYDRRYHHPEMTHDRVRAEAALAAALAREYSVAQSPGAENSAGSPDSAARRLAR
jgi:hypothetical protein